MICMCLLPVKTLLGSAWIREEKLVEPWTTLYLFESVVRSYVLLVKDIGLAVFCCSLLVVSWVLIKNWSRQPTPLFVWKPNEFSIFSRFIYLVLWTKILSISWIIFMQSKLPRWSAPSSAFFKSEVDFLSGTPFIVWVSFSFKYKG